MNLVELLTNSMAIAPELMLAVALCAVLLADMLIPLGRSRIVCGSIATAGFLLSLILVMLLFRLDSTRFFMGTLVVDRLALIFKLLFTGGGLVTILFALRSREFEGRRFGEFACLVSGAVIGACLMASADNFVIFLLGMETLSLCSYVLAAYLKQNRFSAEAGLKYVLFGAVATGIMLFGLSYLYGLSGSLSISEMMVKLTPGVYYGPNELFAFVGLGLVLAGVGFKMAIVPFHSWCPDIYQGSPTPVTAFLSVVSKAAGFAALLRFLLPLMTSISFVTAFPEGVGPGVIHVTLGILGVVTMTLGNLVAVRQTNVKRLLAYSSIAHAGYLVSGLTVLSSASVEAVLMYLAVYFFMNLGAFWVVIVLENSLGSSELDAFRGASFKAPLLFVVLFICLVSLTGLPPTAGFVAKFRLFGVIVAAGIDSMGAAGSLNAASIFYFTIALVGALNSVVSLFYYMKVASVMVFKEPAAELVVKTRFFDRLYAVALSLPLLLLLNFGPLVALVDGVVPQVRVPSHVSTINLVKNI